MLRLDPDDPDEDEQKLANASAALSTANTSTILTEADQVTLENYKVCVFGVRSVSFYGDLVIGLFAGLNTKSAQIGNIEPATGQRIKTYSYTKSDGRQIEEDAPQKEKKKTSALVRR